MPSDDAEQQHFGGPPLRRLAASPEVPQHPGQRPLYSPTVIVFTAATATAGGGA